MVLGVEEELVPSLNSQKVKKPDSKLWSNGILLNYSMMRLKF